MNFFLSQEPFNGSLQTLVLEHQWLTDQWQEGVHFPFAGQCRQSLGKQHFPRSWSVFSTKIFTKFSKPRGMKKIAKHGRVRHKGCVAANLMESSDANHPPQEYEMKSNPEHVKLTRKFLSSLTKIHDFRSNLNFFSLQRLDVGQKKIKKQFLKKALFKTVGLNYRHDWEQEASHLQTRKKEGIHRRHRVHFFVNRAKIFLLIRRMDVSFWGVQSCFKKYHGLGRSGALADHDDMVLVTASQILLTFLCCLV